MVKKLILALNYLILDVLKKYKLDKKRIAIELNGSIVSKSSYHKKF